MWPIWSMISDWVCSAICLVSCFRSVLCSLYLILISSWSSSLVSMFSRVAGVSPCLPIWIMGLIVWARVLSRFFCDWFSIVVCWFCLVGFIGFVMNVAGYSGFFGGFVFCMFRFWCYQYVYMSSFDYML